MRRWLLWNLRCRRGRRCADVIAHPVDTLPMGMEFGIDYTCAGCGTRYRWYGDIRSRERI